MIRCPKVHFCTYFSAFNYNQTQFNARKIINVVAIYSILCFIRLQFADANSDKGENLEEVAYTMVCPSPDLYKDLHSDMVIPKLTTKLLEDYLQPMGKKLGDTDKNMYSEKYLSFVRICNKGRKTYIHAECHAEMKKSVAYKLDIILESDGVISECQCECTVGSGPSAHCKHVCACLYGLCLFGDGKPILTQETCTQKLQTFHVAKKHTGTPVKAHNLPLSHVNERIRYDPRPPKFRREEGSFDRVRNLCINYASSFSASLPMLQLCPPANMLGICHDHDYFQLTAEDHFLHRHHIISISDSDIAAIEQRTRGQCGNKNWLQERCYRLQASNFGRICKATERTDFRKLAASLTEVNEFSSLATDHGKKSESAAIAKYEELKRTTVAKSGIVVSKQKPYLACSPDGLVHDDLLVEVKCPILCQKSADQQQLCTIFTEGCQWRILFASGARLFLPNSRADVRDAASQMSPSRVHVSRLLYC
jgi:hypothetical protein